MPFLRGVELRRPQGGRAGHEGAPEEVGRADRRERVSESRGARDCRRRAGSRSDRTSEYKGPSDLSVMTRTDFRFIPSMLHNSRSNSPQVSYMYHSLCVSE